MLRLILYGAATAAGAALVTQTGRWPLPADTAAESAFAPLATLPGAAPVLHAIALLAIGILPWALGLRAGREIVLAPTWMRLAWVFGIVTFFLMLPWQVLALGGLGLAGVAAADVASHHWAAATTGAAEGFLPPRAIGFAAAAALLGGIALGKRRAERALKAGEATRQSMQDWITGSAPQRAREGDTLWRDEEAGAGRWSDTQSEARVAARRAAIAAHEAKAPPTAPAATPVRRESTAEKWAAAAPAPLKASDILAAQREGKAAGVVTDMRAKKRNQETITPARPQRLS